MGLSAYSLQQNVGTPSLLGPNFTKIVGNISLSSGEKLDKRTEETFASTEPYADADLAARSFLQAIVYCEGGKRRERERERETSEMIGMAEEVK